MPILAPLLDAHNHLQQCAPEIVASLPQLGVKAAVVNGTSPSDWEAVETLARRYSWVIPSYGVHPWQVDETLCPDWRERLFQHLEDSPGDRPVGIGEIGLDRWKYRDRLEPQSEVFRWQLALAAERNLPTSIHCLRAWGALLSIMEEAPLPARGFLLHAYGGPPEMVPQWVRLGAYFSFSGSFLDRPGKLEAFRLIPPERLLIETDAPSMPPPDAWNRHPLPPDADGSPVHHPGNLAAIYDGYAAWQGLPCEELSVRVAETFHRFFSL